MGRVSTNSQPAGLSGDLRRTLLARLLDDASLFPPGNLPMSAAVSARIKTASAWFGELAGPFVCPETKLTELGRALTAANTPWIDLSLVVTGGAAAVSDAADAVPLTAIADPEAAGALLDVADQRGYRPKLRTGGVTPEAFPSEETLAGCLAAVAGRRIRFKCTAGLHHAVRCTDEATGLEQHGFLNVLLATGAAAQGADASEVAAILAQRDRAAIAAAVRALDGESAAEIRWLFTSFGTCSTDEPVADLVSLGLLSKP